MRAMIQQTQAELVRSTLSSQAEGARSLDVLRSLHAPAADAMAGHSELRMFPAELSVRAPQELYSQHAAHQATDDPFRLSDALRPPHDPRAGLGGYLASTQ